VLEPTTVYTRDLAPRMPLVHPPEPEPDLLISDVRKGIYVGKTRFLKVPVFWDFRRVINPHIAICGITGSGKSYLVKTFLTRAALIWNSNAIILDWVGEYDRWVRQAGGKVISLGKEHLNLLDLGGMSPSERIQQILSSLEILADLKSFPDERNDIEEALEYVYEKKKEPTLMDVVKYLEKKNKRAMRLLKRYTTEGSDFFAKKSTLKLENLLNSGLVCIDLHSLPTEEMRSLAGLTILQFIKEKMRRKEMKEEKGIDLFVVLDEAWKIAQDERSDVITIVREGRKYNFALIVASQNPNDVHKTIFSNVGTMFILRLVLKEFREYVQHSLGYSDFIDNEIARFGVGDAAVHMIFAERRASASTFLLKRIDGEDPLFVYSLEGGGMAIEMEREQFIKLLYGMGLSDEQINMIRQEFEKNDGKMDGVKLVGMLEKFGYARSSIIAFMRQIGAEERSIVQLFALLKRRTAEKGVVDLYLEE